MDTLAGWDWWEEMLWPMLWLMLSHWAQRIAFF